MRTLYCMLLLVIVNVYGYERQITMDAHDKFNVSWTASFQEQHVIFQVRAETKGWVGIGLSPNGGMTGADIIIAWVDSEGMAHIEDLHGESNDLPQRDALQDVELVDGREEDGVTEVTFIRKFDTCDHRDDRTIEISTTRLIYAFGKNDPIANQLSLRDYHGQQRGVKSVYLLDKDHKAPVKADNTLTYDFTTEMEVPSASTTYYCSYHKAPPVNKKHHIFRAEPIISPGNEGMVHHLLVYMCSGDVEEFIQANNRSQGVCRTPEMPDNTTVCREVVFGWAVGGTGVSYPEHTGYPIGGEGNPDFFMLETHYDNPTQISGRRDASGMRVFYSDTLREFDSAALTLGVVNSIIVPPHAPEFKVHSYCFGDCTQMFPEGGIKVFGVLLHAHLLGRSITIRWFRDGEELEPLAYDNTYDFNYQEMRVLPEEKTILPGDELLVTCTMNSLERENMTYGGEATQDEMCGAFLIYYPKQSTSFCGSLATWGFDDNNVLWQQLDIEVEKKNVSSLLEFPISDKKYLDVVTWNDELRSKAQLAYDSTSHYSLCMSKNGTILQTEAGAQFKNPDPVKLFEVAEQSTCNSANLLSGSVWSVLAVVLLKLLWY